MMKVKAIHQNVMTIEESVAYYKNYKNATVCEDGKPVKYIQE